jgi:hypothetical protein
VPKFLGLGCTKNFYGPHDPKDEGTVLLQNVGIYQLIWHDIPEGLQLQ